MAVVDLGSQNNAIKTDIRTTLAVGDGETSDWIIFGSGIDKVSVDLLPSGTARVETSNDINRLRNGPGNVTPIPWDAGDVTTATARFAQGVVAFRIVSVSGAAEGHFNGVRE